MKRAILMIAAMLAACSTSISIDAAPDIARFHRQLDAEDYSAIWKDTAQEMRKASTEVDLTKVFEAVHRKLGKVVESKQAGWRTNVTTGGTFAEVQMETRFEKGKGVETFVFRKDGERLKLAGYHINSNDMMVN